MKVERNQPGKASCPRVFSRVSSRGRLSRVSEAPGQPPTLTLGSQHRLDPRAAARTAAKTPAAAATGRLPGAGRGRGRRGRAGHVGGRRAGTPAGARPGGGELGLSHAGRCPALPIPHPAGVPGLGWEGEGRPGPGACPAPIWEIIYWVREKGAQPAESRSPEDSSRDLCPNGILWRLREPWAARAARAGEGPGQALGAPASPTRLTLGVSGPA